MVSATFGIAVVPWFYNNIWVGYCAYPRWM